MELPILSYASSASFSRTGLCSSSSSSSTSIYEFPERRRSLKLRFNGGERSRSVIASAERSSEGIEKTTDTVGGGGGGGAGRFAGTAMEVTTLDRGFANSTTVDFPIWDKIGAVVRLTYGIGIYGAMAVAGRFICSVTGIDSSGGFDPSLDALLAGLGYATPPIMALLFILDDEVVKLSPHARAIRDVEDEELRSFFFGMSPWQFILIVAASSIGEELFYRVAVQGALSDIFLKGTQLMTDSRGMASLTGMFPPFVPFAEVFAAVITATLTGSLYFLAASPKDPTYIVAPVLRSRRDDFKKLLSAWYEKRQMKKIYSPLLEGLLALYLGIEWVQTDNILAPMMTHGIYSAVILGHGLWKIHDHRRRLRRRIEHIRSEATDKLI
ncbi:CAAX prenyl protease 2 [Arabidopsis suecica]|uniref:CAAX prenyl protease 2 n=1 Tax=Arabidopsis suecica TaxID=45249 RepID=A0A8T2GH69_ARASU|nr:CAAX prenyl protease 2 [Arabidopsis suecica]